MNTNSGDGQGIVFKKNLGQYSVHSDGREIACALSSRLHKQLIYPTADPSSLRRHVQRVREIDQVDPVAIGDVVRFVDAGEGRGMITEILPRRNKLSRPATTPGQRVFEQVIVANADQVVPVFAAANPTPKWGLLDRYLVAAEAAGLPALICVTKTDLGGQDSELEATLAEFQRRRKPVIDAVQGAAFASLLMFERAEEDMHLDPLPFAFKLMTRSKKIDYEKLKQRDPKFIAAYDEWLKASKPRGRKSTAKKPGKK